MSEYVSSSEAFGARRTLQIESGELKLQTLADFIVFLKSAKFDPEREFHNFEVPVTDFPIQAADIQALTAFPYEFQLYERKGGIVVSTGTETTSGKEQNSEIFHTKLSMHTHPHKKDEDESYPLNIPSFGDLVATRGSDDPNRQLIIASPEGLVVYRRPVYDPKTQLSSLDDPREILLRYTDQKEVEGYYPPSSNRQCAELERQFAEETKSILKRVSWDDSESVVEIIKVINLRKCIDADYPDIPSFKATLSLVGLTDTENARISFYGDMVDTINNKYGRFHDPSRVREFLVFLNQLMTEDLEKKATSKYFKENLGIVLNEINKLSPESK